MSSGNEQTQNKASEGEAVMEASQTQSSCVGPSSDSSPRAQTDKTNQDQNNSNASVLNERCENESSVKPDGSPTTGTPSAVQAAVAKDNVVSDADGGTVSPLSKTDCQDDTSAMDQGAPTDSAAKVEPMDLDIDAQPVTQPASVELPPLNGTSGTTRLHESEEKTDNDLPSEDGGAKTAVVDVPTGNVVELPPLDQSGGASEASASTSGAKDGKDATSGQSVYYIKWIHYKQNKVPIITQNENGPCPLLAIMNVLLLKSKVKLAPMIEMITSEQLMTYLGECILDSMPENLSESVRANYEQNMQDAMSVMYKLQTGLDVNVKFTGVADFEYTPECIIFDLLGIPLYHGWLVDPQDPVCTSSVGTCSYNQLVEKIIAQKSSEKEESVTEALVAEQFLDRTASQLTYYGLCELSQSVKEGELCVFFRNNHFSTLYRVDNELFLLVTDQGFLTESNVVWETLSNVEGDCHFVDMNFRTYTKPEPPAGNIASSPVAVGSDQQIDQDYQVALSLQHENEMREEQEVAWGQYTQESSALQMADHELARRLQEEEDRRAAAAVNASQQRAAQQQGQGQAQAQAHGHGGQGHPPQAAAHSSNSRQGRGEGRQREEKKDKDCTIL